MLRFVNFSVTSYRLVRQKYRTNNTEEIKALLNLYYLTKNKLKEQIQLKSNPKNYFPYKTV
jgi:hypothetical protein